MKEDEKEEDGERGGGMDVVEGVEYGDEEGA